MRYTTVAAAIALTLVTVSTSLHGQRPDDQIDPRSLALLQKGIAAQSGGNLDGATDLFETALAVDPRNRAAFVRLGQVAEKRGLDGSAIRYYRAALLLEPNDRAALEGEGEALVAKGAVKQAQANLVRLRTLCGKEPCGEATRLTAAIAKGPPVTTVAAKTPTTVPPALPAAAKD